MHTLDDIGHELSKTVGIYEIGQVIAEVAKFKHTSFQNVKTLFFVMSYMHVYFFNHIHKNVNMLNC